MRRLNEQSHLDLCCLQKPIIITCGIERVKGIRNIFKGGNSVKIVIIPYWRRLFSTRKEFAPKYVEQKKNKTNRMSFNDKTV